MTTSLPSDGLAVVVEGAVLFVAGVAGRAEVHGG